MHSQINQIGFNGFVNVMLPKIKKDSLIYNEEMIVNTDNLSFKEENMYSSDFSKERGTRVFCSGKELAFVEGINANILAKRFGIEPAKTVNLDSYC